MRRICYKLKELRTQLLTHANEVSQQVRVIVSELLPLLVSLPHLPRGKRIQLLFHCHFTFRILHKMSTAAPTKSALHGEEDSGKHNSSFTKMTPYTFTAASDVNLNINSLLTE